jgi:hypothetical protein
MNASKTNGRFWIVRERKAHGESRARVCAPDYAAARERASSIGFKAPWCIALETDPEADKAAAMRALHG